MPHIQADRRDACKLPPNCQKKGELHYCFGQMMQEQFLKNPGYDTISAIRRFFVQTAHRQEMFRKIRQLFRIPIDDVLNEAALAWEIFAIEVVAPYEELKALENGHAYQKSLELIREKLDAVMAKKQTSSLILPGQEKKA